MTLLLVLAAVYAAAMVVRYGRRGLLAVAPSLVVPASAEGGADPTPAQRLAAARLAGLGFRRLGSRVEEGPLRGLGLRSASFTNGDTFADAFEAPAAPGGPARVQLLTAFPDGAALLTADHPRRARAGRDGAIRALPGAPLDRVLAAHREDVARLAVVHGAPLPAGDLAARDAAARAWYRGIGGRELRPRLAVHLANALFALAVLAYCVVSLARSRSAP